MRRRNAHRVFGAARAALLAVTVSVATAAGTARAQDADAAPADSSAPTPMTPVKPDSVAAGDLAVRVGPARGVPASAGRAPEVPGELDADRLRLDGRTSAARQFRERWPARSLDLSLPNDAWDRPASLDAGVPLAGWRPAATDRTPVAGYPLRFGVRNAATAIASPGPARNDALLVSRWNPVSPRRLMEGPAELFASPRPALWWEAALLDRGARPSATESALLFERGDLGLENVGARFTAPGLGPGMAAAYTRRASDGAGGDAFWRATDVRYAAVVMLPGRGALRGRVEGDIAKRRIEDAWPDPAGRARAGESLLDDRSLALHLDRRAGAWEQRFRAETARSGHTGIEIDGIRERWEEPNWTVGAESRWRPAAGWTWIAAARGTGRDLRFRAGPGLTPIGVLDTSLRETRREARAGMALRRESGRPGRSRGWGVDVAYDAREEDHGFLDARLHASVETPRGTARVDVESSHERPSWEDRLLPERDRVFEDIVVLPKPVRYTSSGDPSLRPRRLNGAAAFASWRASTSIAFTATASARHVEDDFGWNLTRAETADSILVEDRAVRRGDGWTSHATLGVAATSGPIMMRALGWALGGSSSGTPRAGALPRLGLDASVDAFARLFRGDLPLRFGVEARVSGRREGPIRAASSVLLSGTIRADFDDAGVFLRIDDLLDRRPPSGVYEISTDAGASTAGRRLRFGVVWHLLD